MNKYRIGEILRVSQAWPDSIRINDNITYDYEAKWRYRKHWLREVLGGNMYRTKEPITIHLNKWEQSQLFDKFMMQLRRRGCMTPSFESYLQNLPLDGFFNNRDKDGSKVSRNFKRFIADETELRWTQDAASQIMQQDKLTGYLTISIDPFDFLTMSMNNEGWKSCQRLTGDYRVASLSYMLDEVTAVVYLSDGKETHDLKWFPFPWNSKKWRMLVHIKKNGVIYFNRQYPFKSDALEQRAFELLTELIDPKNSDRTTYRSDGIQEIGYNRAWHGEEPHYSEREMDAFMHLNSVPAFFQWGNSRVWAVKDIIDTSDYVGFNDLQDSNSYSLRVSWPRHLLENGYSIIRESSMMEEFAFLHDIFGIKVGEKVLCPVCGQDHLADESRFLCASCIDDYGDEDSFYTCYSCGDRIDDGQEEWTDEEECYCPACFSKLDLGDDPFDDDEEEN